jgi:hypothetical protein
MADGHILDGAGASAAVVPYRAMDPTSGEVPVLVGVARLWWHEQTALQSCHKRAYPKSEHGGVEELGAFTLIGANWVSASSLFPL